MRTVLPLLILFVGLSAAFYGMLQVMTQLIVLYRKVFTRKADQRLSDLFMFVDPANLFHLNLALFVVCPVLTYLITGMLLGAFVAACVIGFLPQFIFRHLRNKRLQAIRQQTPDALLAIAAALRAGASPVVAIEKMAAEQRPPISQEFELYIRELRLGVDPSLALVHLNERIPLEDFQLATAGMMISREVGGNLSNVLESISDTLRKKMLMEGKINALTAQGKLQGWVMSALPMLLMAILFVMEPEAMGMLFTTPKGWMVLGIIVVMETLGFLSIKKVTTIDV
jgi:tight adherence protein B